MRARATWAGVALTSILGCSACAPGRVAAQPEEGAAAHRAESGGGGVEAVLAIVGGQEISAGTLQSAVLERYYGGGALLGLVRESLFRQEAERLGIVIDPAAVDARVEQEVTAYFGAPGEERTRQERAWAARGLRAEDLRRSLRRESENLLLLEHVVKAQREIGERQLQTLYDRTYRRDRVRVRHIALPFLESGILSAARAEEVRATAEDLAQQVRGGADFAILAARHSGNADTAARGGEMGWIDESTLSDPEMTAAIFGLEVGAVSAPFRERDYGWHLFRVDERLSARPLEEVRGELLRILADAPPAPEEVAAVEELLWNRSGVILREVPVRAPCEEGGDD